MSKPLAFQNSMVFELFRTLPPASLLAEGGDINDSARAALRYLVDRIEAGRVPGLATLEDDPSTCPNCGKLCELKRSPYCGDECREVASFARQFRTGLTAGWLSDGEKQIALGQNLWYLLGGGRPLRCTLVPEKARLKVIEREKGVCQSCGCEATTIDHAVTGCNRPINLRAVCEECCRDRPFGDIRVMELPEYERLLGELSARIAAPTPLRACDDAATWDWRDYLARRNAV